MKLYQIAALAAIACSSADGLKMNFVQHYPPHDELVEEEVSEADAEKLKSMGDDDYALVEIEDDGTTGTGGSTGTTSPTSTDGGKVKVETAAVPVPLIVGISVGVVVLCAVGIGAYVYSSSGKKKEEAPTEEAA